MATALYDKLDTALRWADYLPQAEKKLERYGTLQFVDEKIDEGIDDDDTDDEYLMMRSYDFVSKDGTEKYYIKLYYGDKSEELGYYTIQDS